VKSHGSAQKYWLSVKEIGPWKKICASSRPARNSLALPTHSSVSLRKTYRPSVGSSGVGFLPGTLRLARRGGFPLLSPRTGRGSGASPIENEPVHVSVGSERRLILLLPGRKRRFEPEDGLKESPA